jgi:hypothetical protein
VCFTPTLCGPVESQSWASIGILHSHLSFNIRHTALILSSVQGELGHAVRREHPFFEPAIPGFAVEQVSARRGVINPSSPAYHVSAFG